MGDFMSKLTSASFSVVSIAFIITSIVFTFLGSYEFLVPPETFMEYTQMLDPVSSISFLLNDILLNPQPHIMLTFLIWGVSIFLVSLQLEKIEQVFLLPLFAIGLTIFLSFLVSVIGVISNALIFSNFSSLITLSDSFENFLKTVLNNNIQNLILLYIELMIPSVIGFKVADTYLVEYIEEEPEKLL